MSELVDDSRKTFSIINSLNPKSSVIPVIPPTSQLNFIKNWWQRSEETSSIAEIRMIQRIYGALPTSTIGIPIFARVGKISIDKKKITNNIHERYINTLYISQQPTQNIAFEFETKPNNLLETIQNDIKNEPSARNLVICPGYGGGIGFFYRNYLGISQQPGWRILSIDWLGMGNSSRPEWTLSRRSNQTWDEALEEVENHFVESLEDWRAKVGLDKMTLLGYSFGAYFTACYALKYPQHVEKLILVSPVGVVEDPPVEQLKVTDETPQEILKKEVIETDVYAKKSIIRDDIEMPKLRRMIPSWATYFWDRDLTPMSIVRTLGPFGPNIVYTYISRRFGHLSEGDQHDLYDYLYNIASSTGSSEFSLAAVLTPGSYPRKPLFERLAKLKMPTVFIFGESDWIDYKAAEKAKTIMQAPLKVIRVPFSGHHMYLENPVFFNKVVRDEMKE